MILCVSQQNQRHKQKHRKTDTEQKGNVFEEILTEHLDGRILIIHVFLCLWNSNWSLGYVISLTTLSNIPVRGLYLHALHVILYKWFNWLLSWVNHAARVIPVLHILFLLGTEIRFCVILFGLYHVMRAFPNFFICLQAFQKSPPAAFLFLNAKFISAQVKENVWRRDRD